MANGLKNLVSEIMRETGYNPPSSFVGNNSQDARRMVAIVNKTGRELARTLWQRQVREFSVSVSATSMYALPAGFYAFLGNTGWNGTEPVLGPITNQEWQFYTNGIVNSGINYKFRIFTELSTTGPIRRLNVDPTLSAAATADTLEFNYQTEYWAVNVSASVTYKTEWTTDDDDPTLDTDLFTAAVRWRWLKAKGQDFTADFRDFQRTLNREKARDMGGLQKLRMDGHTTIDTPNIPETNVGL